MTALSPAAKTARARRQERIDAELRGERHMPQPDPLNSHAAVHETECAVLTRRLPVSGHRGRAVLDGTCARWVVVGSAVLVRRSKVTP